MGNSLSPDIQVKDGVTVVLLGPGYEKLSEHLMDHLREVLLRCCEEANPPRVVIDLSHTTFFGSSFIEILVQFWKRISERDGGDFAICGLTANCAEVLHITQLDSLWNVFPSQSEAIAALAGGK